MLKWTWPRDTSLQYCAKVAAASLLGYLLSFGDSQYAVYGAFSAALIVGASRGEDVSSAANRVRGSLAGMLVGVLLSQAPIPPAFAVAIAIGATAYLCMGCGWGVSAARIGASLCAVTVLMHHHDALDYTAMRSTNTLIGIAAGLVISYLMLPVRGHDAMARSARRAFKAVAALLATLKAQEPPPGDKLMAVVDSLAELEKALKDAGHEFGGDASALRATAREAALACIGALTAALAQQELVTHGDAARSGDALRARAHAFAARAGVLADGARVLAAPAGEPGAAAYEHEDEIAQHAFALGLRNIESALQSFERAAPAR